LFSERKSLAKYGYINKIVNLSADKVE